MKHPDMRLAMEKIMEGIKNAEQRRDHYKRMSPKQKVSIPDRFGAQIFDADQMVWLYSNEVDSLKKISGEIYDLFTVRISGRPPKPETSAVPGADSGAPS